MLKLQIHSRFLILFLILCCNSSAAQEEIRGGAILISPITWGTVVYVRASKSTKKRLLNDFKAEKEKPSNFCNTDYDSYENWYCDREPELIFEGLDGYGKKTYVMMLCKPNDFFNEYKYLSKEIFIHYECLVASKYPKDTQYEFHTINEWFGS